METTGAAIGIDTAFGSVAPAPVAVRVVGLRRLRSRRLVAVNADTRVAVVMPEGHGLVVSFGNEPGGPMRGRVVVRDGFWRDIVAMGERQRRVSWQSAVIRSLVGPQCVTAAALRERGLREGWLR